MTYGEASVIMGVNCCTGPPVQGSWASNKPMGTMAVPLFPQVCDGSSSGHTSTGQGKSLPYTHEPNKHF